MRRWWCVAFVVVIHGCAIGPLESNPASNSRASVLSVDYTLSTIFADDALQAVVVAMSFKGDPDGVTVIELPNEFAGQKELWRNLSDFEVKGASIEQPSSQERILHHRPNQPLSVTYRVNSAYKDTPTSYAKGGAIIRSDWLASFGEALFASVKGREQAPAFFRWAGWPSAWSKISDLDHGQFGRAMTGSDIVESTLLAGPNVQLFERQIPNGVLRLGVRGAFDFPISDYVDAQTRIIASQRKFWADAAGPYTVTLYALKDVATGSSAGGTGRTDGFALEATPDIDLSTLARILAHEHTHTWIPRRVGELPKTDEALEYWFSEGVTEFYTARTLLAGNVWTLQQFADDLNEALARYAGSPVHNRPNSAIAQEFWSDNDVQQLPYDRGRLFALLVDKTLRAESGGATNYDSLLGIMRDRWRSAPSDAKPEIRAAFIDAGRELGLDVRPLLTRYIDQGEQLVLPPDVFNQCATLRTVRLANFDPGFDRAKSSETGLIAGVVPGGPAANAGLKDGMQRIAYVSSKEGDARVPMSYQVSDQSGERVISWLPAGRESYEVQEIQLTNTSDGNECKHIFGGSDVEP